MQLDPIRQWWRHLRRARATRVLLPSPQVAARRSSRRPVASRPRRRHAVARRRRPAAAVAASNLSPRLQASGKATVQYVMRSPVPAGDTEQIWSEFSDRLRAFISRRVDSAADAEDIL